MRGGHGGPPLQTCPTPREMRLMHNPHMVLKSTTVSLLFVFAISGLLMPGIDQAVGQDREPNNATLVVRSDQAGPVINKNIYGQFAEHLGRLIYDGLWVGEDSPIPNTRGLRNDVVAALRELHVPVLRWPGGCFADEYHCPGASGPPIKPPKSPTPTGEALRP